MWFSTNFWLYWTKSLGPFILDHDNLMQYLGLVNITFNKFLIKLKKSINLLCKFSYWFSGQYRIFKLRSLFAYFEPQKSVEFSLQPVVQNLNSKHLDSNAPSFQIMKNGKFMQAEIIALWKIQSNYWSGIRNKTIEGT